MFTENEYVFRKDGDDKYKMNVKGKPEIFGIIEKQYDKEDRTKFLFSIKYYWNKVYQGTKYEDELEIAKETLKGILTNVNGQVKEIQYEKQVEKNVKTFESFINGKLNI